MKKFLFPLLVFTALSSCNKEVTPGGDPGALKEIRLGSGITGRTKAACDGDVAIVGLQFLRKDATAAPGDFSGCRAIPGSRALGGVITFGEAQYYAASGNTYFVSYFPAGTVRSDVVTWNIDGKTDIMTAAVADAGTNTTPSTTASLSYLHSLAQIEVICRASVDDNAVQTRWGNITSIRLCDTPTTLCYAYNGLAVTPGVTKAGIALAAGDYTADFTATAVPPSTNITPDAAGMFVPSASQSFRMEITTVAGGTRIVTIDLGEGNSLKEGQKHVVTLTFQPNLKEIGVSSTIEAWTEGAKGSGTIN